MHVRSRRDVDVAASRLFFWANPRSPQYQRQERRAHRTRRARTFARPHRTAALGGLCCTQLRPGTRRRLRGVVELVADLAEDASQEGRDRPIGALERVDVALRGAEVAVAGEALDLADVEAGLQ